MLKLIRFETTRILTRKRLYVLWLLLLGSVLYMFLNRHFNFQNPGGAIGQFFESFYPLSLLLPLFIGVGAGDTIAEDRQLRYMVQLLSRTKNRTTYMLAKGISMGIVTSVFVTVLMLFLLGLCLVVYGSTESTLRWEVEMFSNQPILSALLVILSYILACFAIVALLMLTSVWVKKPYIVSCIPFFVFLVCLFAVPGGFKKYNPFNFLVLNSSWITFDQIFYYWLGAILLLGSVAVWLFERTEDL